MARFAIAPLRIATPFELTFRQFRDRSWHLEIPSEKTLQAANDRFLAELGYEDIAALSRSRENSPRGVIRDFILDVNNRHNQGRDRAMAVVDLGYVPERMRASLRYRPSRGRGQNAAAGVR